MLLFFTLYYFYKMFCVQRFLVTRCKKMNYIKLREVRIIFQQRFIAKIDFQEYVRIILIRN